MRLGARPSKKQIRLCRSLLRHGQATNNRKLARSAYDTYQLTKLIENVATRR
jgi:hypothetical protein